MRTGTWLAHVSIRLLRTETFELIVSPAIADLQFEKSANRYRRFQHYVGFGRAFAAALVTDIVGKVSAPFADDQRRASLHAEVITFTWLMLFQLCYYGGVLSLAFSSSHFHAWWDDVLLRVGVFGALTMGFAALLLPALPLLVCFFELRPASRPE